jgi:hypothetical protein
LPFDASADCFLAEGLFEQSFGFGGVFVHTQK